MSRPSISFCYNSTSPRSITEIQKGPLKINNLVDSLHNPQYEHIKLGSSEKIDQPNKAGGEKKKNGEETSIIQNMDRQAKKDNEIKTNVSNVPINPRQNMSRLLKPLSIRLQQYQAVVQDPAQGDFIQDPNSKNKKPENVHPQENKNQEQQIKPQKPDDYQRPSPEKPKYTFAIVPPRQQKKSQCCNIFGWCQKEKQRTYPIKD